MTKDKRQRTTCRKNKYVVISENFHVSFEEQLAKKNYYKILK